MKTKAKQPVDGRWATELVRERMKESQVITHLGFDVEKVEKGRAVFLLDVREHHKQIHGVVHGGILAALADTTAAIAAYSVVPKGTEIATVELKINYLFFPRLGDWAVLKVGEDAAVDAGILDEHWK